MMDTVINDMTNVVIKEASSILDMPTSDIESVIHTIENIIIHYIIESCLKARQTTIILDWETISIDMKNSKISFEINDDIKNKISNGIKLYNSPLYQQLVTMLSNKLVSDFNQGVLFE